MTEGAFGPVRGGSEAVSSASQAEAQAHEPGRRLLRSGTTAALAVTVVVALVSGLWGPGAAAAAALGGALATAALAVGPLLLHATRHSSPPAVTAAAAGGYAAVVVVLGLAFALLAPVGWLSAEHLAVALVTVTVAGLAGQVRAVTRLRVPVFDPAPSEQARGSNGPPDDDAAQSPAFPAR